MNQKKTIYTVLIILIGIYLFTIWYGQFNKELITPASNRIDKKENTTNKVYLISADKNYHVNIELNQGADDMASILGITYIWDGPDVSDFTSQVKYQNEAIGRAVEEGADVIMLAAVDSEKLNESIKKAKEKNVKIIYLDSSAYEDAIVTLSTNNLHAGRTSAITMIEELGSLGIYNGNIGIVSTNTSFDATIQREKGFRETIEEDGRYHMLDTRYDNGVSGEAKMQADQLITNTQNLVGMFATNATSTEGVGNAIKENNNKIVGIGFDINDEIKRLLSQRSLNAVLVQNPYTMGYLGMAEAYAIVNGYDTGPPYIDTGVTLVRPSTVKYYNDIYR